MLTKQKIVYFAVVKFLKKTERLQFKGQHFFGLKYTEIGSFQKYCNCIQVSHLRLI